MTARGKGDYFERQARAALGADSWEVIRAAGSFGTADLWAAKALDGNGCLLLLISCKMGGRIGPGERADLVSTARAAGGLPILAERTRPGWVGFSRIGLGTDRMLWLELRAPRGMVATNG